MLKSVFRWCEPTSNQEALNAKKLHPLIEKLIIERKLATAETIDHFLETEGVHHDPFLMKDMKKTAERIHQAIEKGELILIYGDYDADGVTATSILVKCLRELGAFVDYYIPNRFYEGYGPNEDAFMQAIADGVKLLITVDNGISGIEEAKLLAQHGVDLIITDHHQPKESLPEAFAILHPELEATYPFDYLAGAGVALKLAEALTEGKLADDYYAIAMLGTVGDIVSLVDENRYIVKRGLVALKETKLPGLIALMERGGTKQAEASEVTVGFEICPRLNAPGRMEDAGLSVELLIAEDLEEADAIANQIEAFNTQRQKITTETVEEALDSIDEKTLASKKVLILHNPDWHEGILGIVAGKLAKQWGKAVICLTDDHEGNVKGSARAVDGYHLFELLNQNKNLIEKFGGHALAAGLTLHPENIRPLEDKMNESLKNQHIEQKLEIDLNLPVSDATMTFINQIDCLAPFGEGNRPPLIKIQKAKVKNVKKIGNKLQHLKFTIYDDLNHLEAIAFNQAKIAIYLTAESSFEFVGELKINEWNGKKSPQFVVTDLRCEEFQLIDLRNRQLYDQCKEALKKATFYSDSKVSKVEEINDLVIDVLPHSKEELMDRIKDQTPENIILIPYEAVTFAPREKFIQVYKVVKQHAPFELNDQIYNYFSRLGIGKNELLFILRVFFEIELVIIEGAIISMAAKSAKRDLSEAPTYQLQKAKKEVFEFFDLNTGAELQEVFTKCKVN